LKTKYLGDVGRIGKGFTVGLDGKDAFSKESIKGALGAAGTGLELGSYAVGGPAAGTGLKAGLTGAKGIGRTALRTAGMEAIAGGTGALGAGLREGRSAGQIAGDVAAGTALGGVLGAAAPLVARGISSIPRLPQNVGQGARDLSLKIQESIIKPTRADIKSGYKPETLNKYDIFGSLEDVTAKTNKLISEKGQQLKTIITEGKETLPTEKVGSVIDSFKQRVEQGSSRLNKSRRMRAVQEVEDSMRETYGENWRNAELNIEDLISFKRESGLEAAFNHDPLRSGTQTDKEEVFNTLYRTLKDTSERVAKDTPLANVNKELSELIPVEQAILRRIPVAQRQNAVSLTDMIGISASFIDPSALALTGANRFLKSGVGARTFANIAKRLPRP